MGTAGTEDARRTGLAVIGTGFGLRVHVPALRAAGFEIVGLVGRDRQRTQRRAARVGIPKVFSSPREAFESEEVVAVSIATPHSSHCALALEAIAAGKHVLCEKPLAANVEEAERMAASADRSGLVCMVGCEFRFAVEQALMAAMVQRGAVGEPRFSTFVSYTPSLADPTLRVPEWLLDPDRGGGWLGGMASHTVDRIQATLGPITGVSACLTATAARAAAAEDSYAVLFRMASGASGVMQETGGSWGARATFTRVAGTTGSIWSQGDRVYLEGPGGRELIPVPDELRLPAPPPRHADPRSSTHLELPPYTRLGEVFRAAILGRPASQPVPAATFGDGLATMRVLAAIRRAAHEEGWVEVDHEGGGTWKSSST